ncbi:MAG: hypothetical protein HY692_08760 [Cyanobacteria bacterium NC_groundwater_1444_Ag_S-0.65um_54_12]|nr:hypothetical protein [Cyanobacteria bacterium NC_groundwater_1444_Ag_S-0.65um_54_12]
MFFRLVLPILLALFAVVVMAQGLRQVGNDAFDLSIEHLELAGKTLRVKIAIENLTATSEIFLHHEPDQLNAEDFFFLPGKRHAKDHNTFRFSITPHGTLSAEVILRLAGQERPGLLVLGSVRAPFEQVAIALDPLLNDFSVSTQGELITPAPHPGTTAGSLTNLTSRPAPRPTKFAIVPKFSTVPLTTPSTITLPSRTYQEQKTPVIPYPHANLLLQRSPIATVAIAVAATSTSITPASPTLTLPPVPSAKAPATPSNHTASSKASDIIASQAATPKTSDAIASQAATPYPSARPPLNRPYPERGSPSAQSAGGEWVRSIENRSKAIPRKSTAGRLLHQLPAPKPRVVFLPSIPGDRVLMAYYPPHPALGKQIVLRLGRAGQAGYGWKRINNEHPDVAIESIGLVASFPHQIWSDGKTLLYLRWDEKRAGALVLQVAGETIISAQWASYDELSYWLGPGLIYPRLIYQGNN